MGTVLESRAPGRGREEPSATVPLLSRRFGPALALGGLTLLLALLLWTQARQIHLWTQDEEYFVQLSRLLTEHFPGALWDLPVQSFDERGIQRLTIALLAVPLSEIRGALGLDIARALMSLAFASATIPAYLLARGVRLSTPWALAAAALTVIVPWSILTGSFLTESVAYPAALWAIWGAWRSCVVPGLRSDLVAVALVVAAGFARTNLLVLVVVAPAAATLHALYGGGGLRAAALRLWRSSPLWAVLLVPGAILVALNLAGIRPGPLAPLSGGYITSLELLEFGPIPAKMAGQVSRMVTGAGLVPAVLGVAWIGRQVVRRTSPEAGALALTCLVGFLVVLFSTVYAAPEERYLMLVAPCLLLPGVVAIARRDVPWWGVAISGLLAVVLVARVQWPFQADQAGFLTDPAEAFWSRVVVGNAGWLPGSPRTGAAILALLAVAALVALWRVSGRRAALVPLVLVAAVGVAQVVQTGYVLTKRVEMASGPGDAADWAWVDERVGDAVVGIQAQAIGNTGDYVNVWRELTFWNRQAEKIVTTGTLGLQIPRYGEAFEAKLDRRTGALVAPEGERIPRYMLVPTQYRQLGLRGREVARSTYLPVALVALEGAPHVTYEWVGPDDDGWLPARTDATLRIMRAEGSSGPRCATIGLIAPPGSEGRTRFVLRAGDERATGALPAEGGRDVRIRVPEGVAGVRLTATGSAKLGDGRRVSVNTPGATVGPC
jgi:hypothetical protein